MERNTEISMYLDAPYNKERNIEISMYLYADNTQRGTWKFPCIFLAKVQTSTEIDAKRRQKIINKALFTFWKLLHSPMEFLETKSLYFFDLFVHLVTPCNNNNNNNNLPIYIARIYMCWSIALYNHMFKRKRKYITVRIK